jgi:hypothetical protein
MIGDKFKRPGAEEENRDQRSGEAVGEGVTKEQPDVELPRAAAFGDTTTRTEVKFAFE